MSFYTPFTFGYEPIKTEVIADPDAFEIRRRLNRWMSKTARAGINFTQDMIEAKLAEIRAEVEG